MHAYARIYVRAGWWEDELFFIFPAVNAQIYIYMCASQPPNAAYMYAYARIYASEGRWEYEFFFILPAPQRAERYMRKLRVMDMPLYVGCGS
jgi:hypothetical protein